jgi:hypothetical protein
MQSVRGVAVTKVSAVTATLHSLNKQYRECRVQPAISADGGLAMDLVREYRRAGMGLTEIWKDSVYGRSLWRWRQRAVQWRR